MKNFIRVLCMMTAAVLLICSVTVFCSAEKVTYLAGDANGNDNIEILDATLIQRVLASLATDPDRMIAVRGDVDGKNDGITIYDVTAIQCYLAHLDYSGSVAGESITIDDPSATENTASTKSYELPVVPKKK